jgi:hypothetical protein
MSEYIYPVATDLGSIDRKIEWANYHIHQLDIQIRWFKRYKPYEFVTEPNPEVANGIDKVFREYKPLPAFIPLRIGDVAHNLRAALDHLVCLAVERNGNPVLTDTAFPVWRKTPVPTPSEYKGLVLGKVKGAGKDFVDLMLTLQPYEGGTHKLIWAVDYLDIVDKHRLPIATYVAHQGLTLTAKLGDISLPVNIPNKDPSVVVLLKDGDRFFAGTAADAESPFQVDVEPIVEIALSEPSILQGESPLAALTQLSEFVAGVIEEFRPLIPVPTHTAPPTAPQGSNPGGATLVQTATSQPKTRTPGEGPP